MAEDFTIKNIHNGDVVTYRSGNHAIFFGGTFYHEYNFSTNIFTTKDFTSDLYNIHDSTYDIYHEYNFSTNIFTTKDFTSDLYNIHDSTYDIIKVEKFSWGVAYNKMKGDSVIWNRGELKKMSISDIERKIGGYIEFVDKPAENENK